MTAPEIQNFKNNIGEEVCVPGYTSWLLDKSRAMSFAWEDATTGHQKVVVHINWKTPYNAYFLDAGAYDHEQEILLVDGANLIVESVEEIKEDHQVLYTLIKLYSCSMNELNL